MATRYFTPALFTFLGGLAANNDGDWFSAHREEFEAAVRAPALALIADLAEPLAAISGHLVVDPARAGGSLLRMNRDTRFGGQPYHTRVAMRFPLGGGDEARPPAYYVFLEPRRCRIAAGLWRPGTAVAYAVRRHIATRPDDWIAAVRSDAFADVFELAGESLVNPPRGFKADHPLVDDLRRKDFAGVATLTHRQVTSADLLPTLVDCCRRAGRLMAFVAAATDRPF